MSPVTLSIVRHMSRMRSTPRMIAISAGFMPISGEHDDDERNRPGRDAGGADAAENREIGNAELLPEREIDAGELGEEQDGHAFVEGGAVLIRGRADGQDEAVDLARHAEVLLRKRARRSARWRSTRRSRRP